MSMQLKGKRRRGAAMSSKAKNIMGDGVSEDALLTKSALLGPSNPTNAGEGTNMNKERRWSFQKK